MGFRQCSRVRVRMGNNDQDTPPSLSLEYSRTPINKRDRMDSTSSYSLSSTPLSPSSFSTSSFFSSVSASSSSSLEPTQPKSLTSKTHIPSDSPLLTKPPVDSRRRRFRSFNKDLRRARSFRASRERSSEQAATEPAPSLSGQSVSVIIKQYLPGKGGWKIMPEDQNIDLRTNHEVVEQVLARLRDMQYSGEVIPDKMTLV